MVTQRVQVRLIYLCFEVGFLWHKLSAHAVDRLPGDINEQQLVWCFFVAHLCGKVFHSLTHYFGQYTCLVWLITQDGERSTMGAIRKIAVEISRSHPSHQH